ncbi:MAG: lauroyl acyltransferase [Proteobacteria bacterium]|nr:lauroyl acyltransferase [Pseudomonadota bacterium]
MKKSRFTDSQIIAALKQAQADIAGFVLYALAMLIGRLPLGVLARLGDGLAWLARKLDVREARVARRNLELIAPQMDSTERKRLRRQVLRTTFRGLFETLRFWTRSESANLRLIRAVHGQELFDAALAAGRGLIVAAPHYGNWELLNQWLASRTPITVLYRPPEHPSGEAFLRRVRGRANVQQVAAGGSAVRGLLKTLAVGGVVGILPDQQPKLGDGVFAPFFGVQALTMTLLPRLARRTGAAVLFAVAERIPTAERIGPARFDVHLFPVAPELSGEDSQAAVVALNAGVETIARRDMAQYQWTYKRYNLRPPESGEGTPYV